MPNTITHCVSIKNWPVDFDKGRSTMVEVIDAVSLRYQECFDFCLARSSLDNHNSGRSVLKDPFCPVENQRFGPFNVDLEKVDVKAGGKEII